MTAGGFDLVHLGELMVRPEVATDYLWGGRLVAGTVSCVAAKPKVGKSVFARNLSLAVATGSRFLGSETKRGPVLYLALEERAEDVLRDFRRLGADGSENIFVATGAPSEAVSEFVKMIRARRPALAVVDPLFRLARIRDGNSYAETYNSLGPLIDLSREVGSHIMFLHHSGKAAREDAIDAPLGSTALASVVSCLVVMRRTESHRTIQTVQRIGDDLPETVLNFDRDTLALNLGDVREDVEQREAETAILRFLQSVPGGQSQAEIRKSVDGRTSHIRHALSVLARSGKLTQTGSGKRGDPFLYAAAKGGSAGSHTPAGTTKPETEKAAQTPTDIEAKVVPESQDNSFLIPAASSALPGDECGYIQEVL